MPWIMDPDTGQEREVSNADYLRDLADRIFQIPAMYGTDQSDYNALRAIARELESQQ